MWDSAADDRFAGNSGTAARLRAAAARLSGELEAAGLHQAAAHAAMAADAVARFAGASHSSKHAAEEPDLRTDVEIEFELDEHGRVWMIREGDCWSLGRLAAVRAEMVRFLAEAGGAAGDSHA